MLNENNSNKEPGEDKREGEDTYSYPRPSSVQPPSNYPYSLPPEDEATPPPYPGGYNPSPYAGGYNPPPYPGGYSSDKSYQSPRAFIESGGTRPELQPQYQEEQAQPAPLPLPLHRVVATYVLLGLMIAMYVLSVVADGSSRGIGLSGQFSSQTLINLGALYTPLVVQGEWWRLITVMFLHANLIHIFLNGLNMYILGKQLEALFGPVRYTAIFFISGFTGSVVSFGLHDVVLGVGASGAIFGLLGATIGYFLRQRENFGLMGQRYLRSLLGTAALNFAILILIPGIDNFAHAGGLVGGLVLGYLCTPLYKFAQTQDGRLRITQEDKLIWLFFALGWLALAIAAFLYFLNTKQPQLF